MTDNRELAQQCFQGASSHKVDSLSRVLAGFGFLVLDFLESSTPRAVSQEPDKTPGPTEHKGPSF